MNKIEIEHIRFPFSESGDKRLDSLFKIWEDAEIALSRVNPPDLGYYKTDFEITWEDGEIYEGRYDIGSDFPTLKEHVLNFLNRMSEKGNSDAKSFVEKYQIGT